MAEIQNLTIPDVPHSVSHLATPSRRGHRHKRSFAISGEFEFLKQPPPPQPFSSSSSSSNHIINDPTLIPPLPTFISSEAYQVKNNTPPNPTILYSPLLSNKMSDPECPNLLNTTTTPRKRDDLFNQASPRFFISTEPKFSSPIKGVPDAIINLDDVLKTRPRSFKSHRRTESAPAGLEIIFDSSNPIGVNNTTSGNIGYDSNPIEEEEDVDNNEQNNSPGNNITGTHIYKYRYRQNYSHPNGDTASKDGKNVANILMSPMRPSSPTFRPISGNINTSPIRNNCNSETSDIYNSMRIKGQRQRYYHYTKQLNIPSNATSPLSVPASYGNNLKVKSNNTTTTTTIQSQSLKEQSSMNSLTSNCSKTSLSPANTPSLQQYNTPSTPISYSEHKKSSFIELHNNTNATNNINNNNKIGNIPYRIPHKKSWTDQTRRQMSPNNFYGQQQQVQLQHLTKGFSQSLYTKYLNNDNNTMKLANNGTSSSFNFESKVYDIEYDDDVVVNIDQDNGKSSNKTQEIIVNKIYQTDSADTDETDETDILDKTNGFILSKDILLGEPGDAVDLSSSKGYDQSDKNNNYNSNNNIDSTRQNTTDINDTKMKTTTNFNNHEIKNNSTTSSISSKPIDRNTSSSNSTVDRAIQSPQSSRSGLSKSGEVTTPNCDSRKFEIRSISDGIMQLNINDTGKEQERRYRKKKSRLSVLINNLFK